MPRVYKAIRNSASTPEQKLYTLKKTYNTVLQISRKVDTKNKKKLFTYATLHYMLGRQIDMMQMKKGNTLVNQTTLLQLPSNEYNIDNTEEEQSQKNYSFRRLFKNANIWFAWQDNTVGGIIVIESQRSPTMFLDTLW